MMEVSDVNSMILWIAYVARIPCRSLLCLMLNYDRLYQLSQRAIEDRIANSTVTMEILRSPGHISVPRGMYSLLKVSIYIDSSQFHRSGHFSEANIKTALFLNVAGSHFRCLLDLIVFLFWRCPKIAAMRR